MSSTLEKTQKILMHTKFLVKQNFQSLIKNEIFTLKNKINTLRNILKKFEFDKARLEAMFPERQTQRKHHVSYTQTPSYSHSTTITSTTCISMLCILIMHTQMHILIMLTHSMHFYMPRCIHAPIVAAKVIWPCLLW